MTTVETKPDVDLADGNFYADRQTSREAYRWMRANQPVFRDRNGLGRRDHLSGRSSMPSAILSCSPTPVASVPISPGCRT